MDNDRDSDDDRLAVTITVQPTNGNVELGESGGVTYTPRPGYVGPDSFTYTVSDGTAAPVEARVDINVTPTPSPAPEPEPAP